jgi:hypothetical protein
VVLGLVIANLPLRDAWRYSDLLFLGWILLYVTGYIALLLKSRLHGLLAVAFLFSLSFSWHLDAGIHPRPGRRLAGGQPGTAGSHNRWRDRAAWGISHCADPGDLIHCQWFVEFWQAQIERLIGSFTRTEMAHPTEHG